MRLCPENGPESSPYCLFGVLLSGVGYGCFQQYWDGDVQGHSQEGTMGVEIPPESVVLCFCVFRKAWELNKFGVLRFS